MKQKKDKEQKELDFERLVQEQRQTIYSVCYLFADEETCPAACTSASRNCTPLTAR